MAEQLEPTKEKMSEYREAFSLFDKSGTGVIDTRDLGLLVRSLNMNPTEDELQQIMIECDPEGNGQVEFPDFMNAVTKRDVDIDHEEELINAFRIILTQKDAVDYQFRSLAHILQDKTSKDPFTDDEIREMQKYLLKKDEDSFLIEDFIKIVMGSINMNKVN